MDLDEAFQVVGEFGAYQKKAVAVLALTQVSVSLNVCYLHEKRRIPPISLRTANVTEKRRYVAFSWRAFSDRALVNIQNWMHFTQP